MPGKLGRMIDNWNLMFFQPDDFVFPDCMMFSVGQWLDATSILFYNHLLGFTNYLEAFCLSF